MKNKIVFFSLVFLMFVGIFNISNNVVAEEIPTTIDSRMKTIIYNPNEVFELKFCYGFQAFIEFSDDEEIEIITLGESFPWKLNPIGKRLFIRPLQINVNTNMTIITTKRTYQFQIKSGSYEEGVDEDLIYSVKFFYPDTTKRYAKTAENKEKRESIFDLDVNNPNLNFDYVMTGNIEELSPLKTFDDGIKTYFEFKNNNAYVPIIYAVDINGNETELEYNVEGNFIVIDSVQMQFSLRNDKDLLCIFNNSIVR